MLDFKCRAPLVLQDVQADVFAIDVWVEHLSLEFDKRGLERVLLWEPEVQHEPAFLVDRAGRTVDEGCQMKRIFLVDLNGDARDGELVEVVDFL